MNSAIANVINVPWHLNSHFDDRSGLEVCSRSLANLRCMGSTLELWCIATLLFHMYLPIIAPLLCHYGVTRSFVNLNWDFFVKSQSTIWYHPRRKSTLCIADFLDRSEVWTRKTHTTKASGEFERTFSLQYVQYFTRKHMIYTLSESHQPLLDVDSCAGIFVDGEKSSPDSRSRI